MVPCKKAEDMTAPPIPQNLKDPLDSGRRPDMTVEFPSRVTPSG